MVIPSRQRRTCSEGGPVLSGLLQYPYVVHAEANAILNKNSGSVEGCRIYTTLFPCNE